MIHTAVFENSRGFSVLAEIEPATRPDLRGVRQQIAVLAPVVDAFLVPDNHLGRATVSSIAVAHEVAFMGGRVVACLNGRDRNELGFRRDLLTAAAYGVDHLLLVGGDRIAGAESSGIKVSAMLAAARAATGDPRFAGAPPFVVGAAASSARPLPEWKKRADFLLVQVSFGPLDQLCEWRSSIGFEAPVLAGVLVLASSAMAERLVSGAFGIEIPSQVIERLHDDPHAGVQIALDQVAALRDSGVFQGAHLIPGVRYRQVTQALLRY